MTDNVRSLLSAKLSKIEREAALLEERRLELLDQKLEECGLDLQDDQVQKAMQAMAAIWEGLIELRLNQLKRARKAFRLTKRIPDEGKTDEIIEALFDAKMQEYGVDVENEQVDTVIGVMAEVIGSAMESEADSLKQMKDAFRPYGKRKPTK